jgi:hypothetical protein
VKIPLPRVSDKKLQYSSSHPKFNSPATMRRPKKLINKNKEGKSTYERQPGMTTPGKGRLKAALAPKMYWRPPRPITARL